MATSNARDSVRRKSLLNGISSQNHTAIDANDLAVNDVKPGDNGDDSNLTLMEAMERNKIIEVLKETGGNKLETARRLGIGRQTLYNKIKSYAIAA